MNARKETLQVIAIRFRRSPYAFVKSVLFFVKSLGHKALGPKPLVLIWGSDYAANLLNTVRLHCSHSIACKQHRGKALSRTKGDTEACGIRSNRWLGIAQGIVHDLLCSFTMRRLQWILLTTRDSIERHSVRDWGIECLSGCVPLGTGRLLNMSSMRQPAFFVSYKWALITDPIWIWIPPVNKNLPFFPMFRHIKLAGPYAQTRDLLLWLAA